ncbi:GFA family protein [Ruegeria marina]|nr:GFA family protein [Ruegeria marina]
MAIDIVGFAGRVSRDEAGTLDILSRLRSEVVEMQVEAHRGRLFKSWGDGFFAEFSSTIEAVSCAVGIQRMVAAEARQKDSARLQLRIGVSLGDVVVQNGDLLGDGVNIAARLEAMAEPGGIAVSGDVMAQVRGKIELSLVDCGFKRLKASDAPIHVFMTRSQPATMGAFLDIDDDALRKTLITGGCLCGKIRYEINAPAISTGYCHCSICQKFSGSAMSTWTAFPASAVRFLGEEPRYFSSSPIAKRGFCPTCGTSLTYRLVRPRKAAYLIVFTPSLDEPKGYAPVAHSGIESQMPWLEILDDLPRTRTRDSRVLQQAWSSVGLPDAETWGPLAVPKEVF